MATSTPKHGSKTAAKPHAKAEPAPVPRDPAELAAMVSADGLPQFNSVSLDKRYVPARLPTGKVIEVWGDAVIRTPEGDVHPLRAGDEVRKGDVILTAQDGIVQMEVDGSRMARLPFGSDLQGPLAQVNASDQFIIDPTTAGDPGGLYDAMRIARINEAVTGQEFNFGAPNAGLGLGDLAGNTVLDAGNQRPAVDVQNITVPESGIIVAGGVQPAAVTGVGIPGFAVFTVHLDSPAIDPVTLKLTLVAGTATLGDQAAGGDFGSSGPFQGLQVSTDNGITWVSADTVAVPEGATTALVRLPLHNDTIDEFDETFTLSAQTLPGSTQTVSLVAKATILDDDEAPNASVSGTPGNTGGTFDTSVPEGTAQASVTVTLSGPSGKPISIDWATADGAAIAGQDYTAAAGTLVFAPGETSKTITVAILNDQLVEPDEAFSIHLSNGVNVNTAPGAPALPSATVTIINDDHAPVLVHPTPDPVAEDTPQTGNVLTGATDADGDPLTVVDYTVGGTTVPAGTPTTLPGVGTVVINPDGTYTFTPAPDFNGTVPPITYHVTDGANVVGDDIQLAITPVNDAPVVTAGTTAVSEEGLVGGLADTLGTPDTTNATSSTGKVVFSDVDTSSTALTAHLVAPTNGVLTSGGFPVTWSGAGTVDDPLVATIDGSPVISATIDNAGNYKVDLLAPIDQSSNAGEDARTINLGVAVSDGQSTTTSTLAVSIEDDAPSFNAADQTANSSLVDTNLLLMLDTSASMAGLGIGGLNRLQSAVQSIGLLLDKYELNGNVAVRLVTFSSTASELGTGWMTVQEAKNELKSIVLGGDTNYDDALTVAQTAFDTAGKLGEAQNVAYFFSDGNPTLPLSGKGIDAAQEGEWTSFLSTNLMRTVAVGLGPEPVASNLDPIAYDGAHGVDTSANLVTSFGQLNSVLAGTVVAPLTGFLPGASAQAVGGADGGYISHVNIDGIDYSFKNSLGVEVLQPLDTITPSAPGSTFTYDANSHVLNVTTAKGGSFTVDMDDGSYGYAAPKGAAGALTETIGFSVGDHDGDGLASTLTINLSGVAPAPAPVPVPPPVAPASVHPTVSPLSLATTDVATADSTTATTATSSTTTQHASPLSDVFSWTLADAGQPGAPNTTHVLGFDGQAASRGGDVLNLHDLLQGEVAGAGGGMGNLDHYLDFSVIGSGAQASTQVQVSSRGGFAGGQVDPAAVDHVISLDHVDLRGALGVDGHAANQQIIEAMLKQGKLMVDSSSA